MYFKLLFCCWVGPVPYLELFWAGPVKKVTLYIIRRAGRTICSICIIVVKFAHPIQDEVTRENEQMMGGPEDPVVDGDHDDDRAPEGHEGGEEGIWEVGVEDTQASVFTNCRFSRPFQLP